MTVSYTNLNPGMAEINNRATDGHRGRLTSAAEARALALRASSIYVAELCRAIRN